ncbi:hypothetical protein ACUY2G_13685 [Corynebacterium guaraldiae]
MTALRARSRPGVDALTRRRVLARHLVSSKRHLAEGICQKAFSRLKTPFAARPDGVFAVKDAFRKTPFARHHVQDAVWCKLFRSHHAADNLAPSAFTLTSPLLSRPTFNDVVSIHKVLLRWFGSEGSLPLLPMEL